MRIKILDTEMTIPNQLFKELEKLRKNSKLRKAVETIIEAGEILENNSKVANANKAAKAKQEQAKEKVKNAVNLLRLQGEEINPYKVAKIAGISYNTARKYTKLYTTKYLTFSSFFLSIIILNTINYLCYNYKKNKEIKMTTKTDEKKNNFKTIKKLMTQLERKEKERVTLQAKLNRLNNDIPAIKKELYLALNGE